MTQPLSPSELGPVPPALEAWYGDDVVVRFTLRTADDAAALADAAATLLLDVWATTREWADIRLTRDMVR